MIIEAILSVLSGFVILIGFLIPGALTFMAIPQLREAFNNAFIAPDPLVIFENRTFLVNEGQIKLFVLISFLVAYYSASILLFYGISSLFSMFASTDNFIELSRVEIKQMLASHRPYWLAAAGTMVAGFLQGGFGVYVLKWSQAVIPWRRKYGYPD